MKKFYTFYLLIVIIITIFNNLLFSQTIPLDGRGGGVLVYSQSSNGTFVAYGINADGTGNIKLINSNIGLNHHEWSPDGKIIASVGYISQATWSIYTFNADGTNMKRLTSTANVWDGAPSWSPDGSKIAFTRTYPQQNNKNEIWIMNSDGSNQKWIGVVGYAQTWAADGNKLIFSSNTSGNWEIYICKADGTEQKQLTNTTDDEFCSGFSPDGNSVLFSKTINSVTGIYTMKPDGTQIKLLITLNANLGFPRWSPDGTMIAFDSDHSGKSEIYIINSDGTNMRKVTNCSTGWSATCPAWKPAESKTDIKENILRTGMFRLYQNYPNPFNPLTTFQFEIKEKSFIDFKIYDINGNKIKTLFKGWKESGNHLITWDAKNDEGNSISSGVYFIKIKCGEYIKTGKAVFMK
jgi:TolB protein